MSDLVQRACDRCTQGIMDQGNPHLHGLCTCDCHHRFDRFAAEVVRAALVEPRLKPDPVECVCGCGLTSTLRSKAWNDGLGPHVRGCRCPRCRGARNRRGGMAKQRAARKPLGIKAQRVGNGNEEYWDDPLFANEVKSGKQVGPLVNWWNRVQAQVQANQADFGSIRKPTRAVAMPEGWGNRGLVVVETETWRTLILPALEAMYGS